ncbi:unnamed protein product [Amoebophrya sp. A120]|nr:unnamed protein product [Amoebophrya sp. A120]|eukprot:GSA120T00014606001.1
MELVPPPTEQVRPSAPSGATMSWFDKVERLTKEGLRDIFHATTGEVFLRGGRTDTDLPGKDEQMQEERKQQPHQPAHFPRDPATEPSQHSSQHYAQALSEAQGQEVEMDLQLADVQALRSSCAPTTRTTTEDHKNETPAARATTTATFPSRAVLSQGLQKLQTALQISRRLLFTYKKNRVPSLLASDEDGDQFNVEMQIADLLVQRALAFQKMLLSDSGPRRPNYIRISLLRLCIYFPKPKTPHQRETKRQQFFRLSNLLDRTRLDQSGKPAQISAPESVVYFYRLPGHGEKFCLQRAVSGA